MKYNPYDRLLDTIMYYLCLAGFICLAAYGVLSSIYDITVSSLIPPCILNSLTGYYCPGCGGTRAVYYLFHGHLLRSLYHHPAVPLVAIPAGLFFISQSVFRIFKKTKSAEKPTLFSKLPIICVRPGYLYIVIAVTLLQWIIKNVVLIITGYSMI